MSSSVDTIRGLAEQDYKWGFVTDIDEDRVPKGLNEDIVRLISARKGEPEFMLEWRLNALRHWFKMAREEGEPKWANLNYRSHRLPGHLLLLGAQAEAAAREPRPGRSRDSAAPTRSSAFRLTSRSCWPAWPSTRCSTGSPSPPRSRASWPRWA